MRRTVQSLGEELDTLIGIVTEMAIQIKVIQDALNDLSDWRVEDAALWAETLKEIEGRRAAGVARHEREFHDKAPANPFPIPVSDESPPERDDPDYDL